jgi:biotin synthase
VAKKVFLCAISNISSGNCSQDCKFCTQSSLYSTDIESFKRKEISQIVREAKIARDYGVLGFCLVTSGLKLDDKKLEFVAKSARAIRAEVEGLNLIACNGLATIEQLRELKSAGVDSYNHNLETSKNFYENICSTHSWADRFQTCLNVKEAGLQLCSGGIFGLGESQNDRDEFIRELKELNPVSIPINFYHPNSQLPIKTNSLTSQEALDIVKGIKENFAESMVMVAGGREYMLGSRQREIFENGADAIVLGDYLTTKGEFIDRDLNMIRELGLEVASSCHE